MSQAPSASIVPVVEAGGWFSPKYSRDTDTLRLLKGLLESLETSGIQYTSNFAHSTAEKTQLLRIL